jgi:hypothetical protein
MGKSVESEGREYAPCIGDEGKMKNVSAGRTVTCKTRQGRLKAGIRQVPRGDHGYNGWAVRKILLHEGLHRSESPTADCAKWLVYGEARGKGLAIRAGLTGSMYGCFHQEIISVRATSRPLVTVGTHKQASPYHLLDAGGIRSPDIREQCILLYCTAR